MKFPQTLKEVIVIHPLLSLVLLLFLSCVVYSERVRVFENISYKGSGLLHFK